MKEENKSTEEPPKEEVDANKTESTEEKEVDFTLQLNCNRCFI